MAGDVEVPEMECLIAALLDGDQTQALSEAGELHAMGFDPEQIVSSGIHAAMTRLDAKCTVEQFNLLEIMLAGRAVMAVIKTLYPRGSVLPQTKGTIIVATPEGDMHDLGKNILVMVLTGKGYRVVDCGKNCSLENLLDAAASETAQAIGVSGLLTTVIPQVRRIKDLARRRGLDHVAVVAGGAALKQSTAESLNVDFVAETAFEGARYLDSMLEMKT